MTKAPHQHVAILINNLSYTGGIERDAIKCMEALASKGWHIHLLVSFPDPEMPKLLSHLPITWHKINNIKRPPSIGQMIFNYQAQKILKQLRQQYPNMHAVTFENHPIASIVVGCNSRRLWHQARKKFGMKRSFRPVWEWWNTRAERLCLQNAQKIAIYSKAAQQDFITHGVSEDRIERIIIPVNTDYFTPDFNHPLSERKEILIIGANPKLKGIDIALQAWKTLHKDYPELSLRIVFRSYKTAAYIKRANLPRVIASTVINDPREYYNKARLVIAPSAYESWGNIITESLALGIPVVASEQVPSSEVIQSQEHGQTFNRTGKNDCSVLANAMREALQTCSTDINTMQSRHQHIVHFQSQHLTSTKWLCSIVEQPLKIQ
ncbi:MAG: glycosyltransferase family 4 protein [Mariprofundaceae bacterium]|nr:glycosyltransferase family 4 protein [Mariprofundaceae bacterium]